MKDSAEVTGNIFNIQRYSIHDGPGIRTVIFFSDCPLRCQWCCNPESFSSIKKFQRKITVNEAINCLMEDKIYFRKSNGGATLSGGEPMLQIRFTQALLEGCRDNNIGTAIETCGEVPWPFFKKIEGLVDYYLYDIKHTDNDAHKDYTGIGNKRIIENLIKLRSTGQNIFLRCPLIPGFNLDDKAAHGLGRLVRELDVTSIYLLPYHRMGENKYRQLKMSYHFQGTIDLMSKPEGKARISKFAEIISNYHPNIQIGG